MKNIIQEYGIPWLFFRILYQIKIFLLKRIPRLEVLFEHGKTINKIEDLYLNVPQIEDFLLSLNKYEQNKVIEEANYIIKGEIKAFSSIRLKYGNPINWHLNPMTGFVSEPNIKWFNINDFNSDRGDIKVIWEPSRFSHLYYLTRAFMITKDEKYYTAFSKQIAGWVLNNRYSYGINYKDGQEASIRMINVLMAYYIFKEFQLTTKSDEDNVKKIVEGSYNKVLSNFSYAYRSIKNNHTISELVGMIIGSYFTDDTARTKKAYALLNEVLDEQFLDDGGYTQKSFNYQRLAIQMIAVALKLEELTNGNISESNRNKIIKSTEQLFQMQQENGHLPNYGSNDGALIFPLSNCDYLDYRPTLNSIFMMLKNERLYEPDIYDEEMFWFNSDITAEKAEIVKDSHISYEDSGLFVFRENKTFISLVLQDYKTRPAHMDQLHLDLWHKGVNIFCDLGTYSYASDIGRKNILNSAHNTLSVEGINQMKLNGPFFIYAWTEVQKNYLKPNEFMGEYRTKFGYKHSRFVKFTDGCLIVKDNVEGSENKMKYVNFHTACDVVEVKGRIKLSSKGIEYGEIIPNKEFMVTKVYQSSYYLKNQEINKITIFSTDNEFNTEIILY